MNGDELRHECNVAFAAGNREEAYRKLMLLQQWPPTEPDYLSCAVMALAPDIFQDGIRFALQGIDNIPSSCDPVDYECSCNFIAGYCFDKLGDLPEALRHFERASALNPKDTSLALISDVTKKMVRSQRMQAIRDRLSQLLGRLRP